MFARSEDEALISTTLSGATGVAEEGLCSTCNKFVKEGMLHVPKVALDC